MLFIPFYGFGMSNGEIDVWIRFCVQLHVVLITADKESTEPLEHKKYQGEENIENT